MKSTSLLASAFLCFSCALPSFPRDWLFVTTNWNEPANEQVLVIDAESGNTRALWTSGKELDVAISPDGARLFVTYLGDKGDELAVIDTATGAVVYRGEIPQIMRWIFPTAPGMAISPDGRWLYLLKANNSAGPSEYSLLTFDTRDNRFAPGEPAISNCPSPHPLPVPGDAKVLVLCGGGAGSQPPVDGPAWHLPNFENFALGRGSDGFTLYTAALDGTIQASDVATREITRTSSAAVFKYRRVRASSGTMSPDGRLWYVPLKIPDNGENEIEQILVFDTQAMSMTGIITPVSAFSGLALSTDGRRLYTSQPDLKSIMVIDTVTHRMIRTLEIPGKPSIILAVQAP